MLSDLTRVCLQNDSECMKRHFCPVLALEENLQSAEYRECSMTFVNCCGKQEASVLYF